MAHCFHIITIRIKVLGKLLILMKPVQSSCCMLKYEKHFSVELIIIYIV